MGNKLAVSDAVRSRLDDLTKALVDACGDKLVGLVVHGSAVRGGWRDGASDVDLVCVLADDSEPLLEAIGPALELARFSARIETMILHRDEIERSADCFPLLYSDIARASTTLAGKNPFEGMVVPDHHKRLRIEQELREIRIRMRRVATDRAPARARTGRGVDTMFAGAIERKIKQARGALWALLERRGDKVDDALDAVLAAACKAFSVDVKALQRVREEPERAFTALAKLLDAALHEIDHEESASRPPPEAKPEASTAKGDAKAAKEEHKAAAAPDDEAAEEKAAKGGDDEPKDADAAADARGAEEDDKP
ncbi:MAG: nucleotidyltransferase domain-containing protein [Deltaproteobacteria bacterium]|nr:nucleotidyltransferase domain-containing protein [Deltaproteobacteria bacterium]MCW5807329.1 nucleotidyltransferase domain-containing protein [Deltaproteobacteria bacterium]